MAGECARVKERCYDTIYFFRIKTRNAAGEEAVSENYTFCATGDYPVESSFTGSIYNSVTEKPTGWFESGQDADIVLGALSDFGKASPTLFNLAGKIATDGNRLLLTDGENNRVLIWNSIPTENNQPPDLVIGQEDLYSNESGSAADKLEWPVDVATDGQHLLVADAWNNRVLIWNEFPTENGEPADLVLGVPDFETNVREVNYVIHCGQTCSDGEHLFVRHGRFLYIWKKLPNDSLAKPDIVYDNVGGDSGVCVFGNKLITTWGLRQIAIWNELPLNGEMPDILLGPEFTNGMELVKPWGIAVDDNYFFVGDYAQNKIFVWEGGVSNTVRDPDFAIDIEVSFPGAAVPHQISSDGKHLVASATYAHKILIWHLPLDKEDLSPNVELGPCMQKDSIEIRLNLPTGVFVDGEHLFVADYANNRVLIWNEIPTGNETPPDIVLGQENFVDTYARRTRDGLITPWLLWFDGSYLWVNPPEWDHRLMRFPVHCPEEAKLTTNPSPSPAEETLSSSSSDSTRFS